MRGRERERESGRRRKEAEDDRDEQRVTREREKEGGRFCRGSGCRFTNPLRPPPVRFPPFRFVSNLEWRFWPRAREEREERKGKWRSRRAQRPPPSPVPLGTSGGVVETQKQCYRSPHRKFFVRKNRSSAFPGPLLSPRPLVRRRGGGFFFIRGWTRLAAARGRPFERYPKGWSVRGRGWLQLISTPSLTPPLVAWKHEHGDDGLQTRRKSKKSKKKKKREVE